MKQILTVQDLSCLGKCSLTVALPIISAMGCDCGVLPTALLSTHTGFPDPYICSLTEQMPFVLSHWQQIGARFDAISVGYLSHPDQVSAVEQALDLFPAPMILDPVMGDHGRLYRGIREDHVQAIKSLCRRATVIVPNITEAALLTGLPYRDAPDPGYHRELLEGLTLLGAQSVILTGAATKGDTTGFLGLGEQGIFSYEAPKIDKQCHGTGDLFAAVLTGALVREKTLPEAATLAARFVERVLAATPEATPFGVAFEPQLPWLMTQI